MQHTQFGPFTEARLVIFRVFYLPYVHSVTVTLIQRPRANFVC